MVQLGWKDSAFCLFISNIDCGVDTIITKRRRPNETAVCAKTARRAFGDLPVKELPRPALTYHYNIDMNAVDRGDQMRASYPVQQRQQKAWKAMFYSLVDIVAVNSFLLSSYAPVAEVGKFLKHRAFREALCKELFAHARPQSIVVVAGPATAATTIAAAAADVADAAGVTGVEHQRVKMKRLVCVICKQAAAEERRGIKRQRRQALQAISPNNASKLKDRHVPRAETGCASCEVSLCTKKGCWEVFHSEAIHA